MQTFTGFEYLCIDIANQWGLDKEQFDNRIQWVKENIEDLELLGHTRDKWKEQPLYLKAVMALRSVQKGEPIGHMVGFDSTASGMQIMSATTGCPSGATITNLTDPDQRYDAYREIFEGMRNVIPSLPDAEHKSVKQAVMTVLYGSKAEPKKLFGEGTNELNVFYSTLQEMAPGACQLLSVLLQSWNAYAPKHSWILPDNHHVHVKVIQKESSRVRIDELGGASFTYEYKVNKGSKKGLANVANVVHSIDAYVLRSLIRRCSYSTSKILALHARVEAELLYRNAHGLGHATHTAPEPVQIIIERYQQSGMVDITYVDEMSTEALKFLDTSHLEALHVLAEQMLKVQPFDILTVHDEFKCHPNNMNQLRFHYREIMAELADSEILSDICSQLYGSPLHYQKITTNLSQAIRGSSYAIC